MPILGSLIKKGSSLKGKIDIRKKSPYAAQQKTLLGLLKKAVKSDFGRFYEFEKIIKSPDIINAFQTNVPVHDYDKMHDEWWHRSLNNEANVTWSEKTKYFALSSGTTGGPSKYLPITKAMLKANNRTGFRIFLNFINFDLDPNIYTKEKMMLGGSTDLIDNGGHFIGDLSGINTSQLPSWIRISYRPGKAIAKLKDWNTRVEAIAQQAPNWDIGFIMGIPSWIQLMLEKIIEHNKVDNIHQIWPNLKVYIHGGIAFEPYKKGFEKLMGAPMIYLDTYLASEGFIAYQDRPEAKGMKLIIDNGIFYEFIPFDDDNFDTEGNPKPQAKILHIDQVEEGIDYAILLSTCAGAWRYLIGDTISFTNKSRSEIIITGRTKHFLSVCGEHLSVDNMNQAIQATKEELNIDIREFTVAAIPSGTSFKHKWYIGSLQPINADKLKNALDAHLKRLNDDYETERNAMLGLEVVPLPLRLFYKWQEEKGKLGGQSKFPRVMKKEQFEDWEYFVKNNWSNK
jgi:GH3 auxin-responsive promoter